VVVHFVVPEESLIAVSPRESLVADVHEGVLGPLRERRLVLLVLPVLVPEAPRVHGGDDEGGDHDADEGR